MTNRLAAPPIESAAIVIEQQHNGVLFAVGEAHSTFGASDRVAARAEGTTMIGEQQRVIRRAEVQGLRLLESDAFTWIFDGATLLFRRVPRDAMVNPDVPTAWTPYYRLEIDEARSSFMVVLDEAGTRVLRARLHGGAAGRDGGW